MVNKIFPLVLLVGLTGCASMESPVPENYSGATAVIRDTVKEYSSSKSDLFSLEAIDDRKIPNSRFATRTANQGRGFIMEPVVVERKVKAEESTFEIVARTEYAAPALALTNKVYQVKGRVHFAPVKGKSYLVKGELGDTYSSVWIEDDTTHEIVDKKIEVHGSSELGFFEK